MSYIKPKDVQATRVQKVIYDGGPCGVSVAEVKWSNGICIGIRWNETDNQRRRKTPNSKGMPISSGKPVWFILPNDIFDAGSDLRKTLSKAKNALDSIHEVKND